VPKGIFNPYKKPEEKKKNFKSPMGENPYDTEYGKREENIRLDGDSYILEFKNVQFEEIPGKLVNLIKDVLKNDQGYLRSQGINLISKDEKYQISAEEIILPTQEGQLCVYVGAGGTEIEAFRRIGYALHQLSVPDILKKHHVKLIARA
jgi:hypothetical protein